MTQASSWLNGDRTKKETILNKATESTVQRSKERGAQMGTEQRGQTPEESDRITKGGYSQCEPNPFNIEGSNIKDLTLRGMRKDQLNEFFFHRKCPLAMKTPKPMIFLFKKKRHCM